MIESFKEFSKKTSNGIFEEISPNVGNNIYDDVVLDAKDQEELKKGEPDIEFISDNAILSKMTMVVIKKLRENIIYDKFCVYPYVLKINEKKCSMICSESESMFFAIYREGINKVITYFTEDPINKPNSLSKLSVSTSKFGIEKAIETLITFLNFERDEQLNEEILAPPRKVTYVAWDTIFAGLYDEKTEKDTIPKDIMLDFLELYNNNASDADIAKLIAAESPKEGDEFLIKIKEYFSKFTGTSRSSIQRVVLFIRFVICGVNDIVPEPAKSNMKKLWFWGAGYSGKIAVETEGVEDFVVKDASTYLEEKIDELENKMKSEAACIEAICKYIKSNGKDEIPMKREMGVHRGLLITGVAGVGKSYNIDKYVEDNLAEGVDYIRFGNQTTGARKMYKNLCQHNNMLLIFDDTPDMFDTEQKIALWKNAMEDIEKKRVLICPDGESKNSSSIYYPTTDPLFTRQDQYYREIGKFTTQERETWIEKRRKEILKTYTTGKKRMTDEEIKYFDSVSKLRAEQDFKKHEKNEAITLLPDSFLFNGIIIYISNKTLASFIKNAGDHWDALDRRMESIDVSPTRKVIWYWLRRKIVSDMNNESIPNDLKMLPVTSPLLPDYNLSDLLTYIDDIVEGKYNTESEIYGKIEWGTIKSFKCYIMYGQTNWKRKIKENMRINILRDK